MKNRKALKSAYRHHKSSMGVFQIKNSSNGKVWIEGSTDMDARWNRHRAELGFGSHRNKELQKDWNRHGPDQFEYSVLANLEYSEEPDIDYTKELKVLVDLVIEQLNLIKESMY